MFNAVCQLAVNSGAAARTVRFDFDTFPVSQIQDGDWPLTMSRVRASKQGWVKQQKQNDKNQTENRDYRRDSVASKIKSEQLYH